MLKNVIVGIDFSECSYNAMKHGISLAANLKAPLTLLYVVSPDAKLVIDATHKDDSDILNFAEVKLKEWVNECKTYLPDIEVTSKIRMGKPSKEINAEAKFQGNAITVLGTHGCSGVKEFFIGSSAFKTVSGASNPILTIRNNIDIHRDLTDILVVIDDTLETLQKLKYAAVLAKNFQAKIHLLGLYTAKYPEIRNVVNAYLERASIYLTEKNVRFETSTTEVTRKIDTVLLEAKKRNVNLIIVMKELELAGENVFMMAPFSERIVNRSNIPILTVPVDTNIYPKEI